MDRRGAVAIVAAVLAAQKATSVIPVLFLAAGDPVGAGLVASLSRPGANVTGVSIRSPDLAAKHLELLREIAPGAKRVAFIAVVSNETALAAAKRAQAAGHGDGVTVETFDGQQRDVLERSFESMKKKRMQALIVGAAGAVLDHRDRIVQFAARERIPPGFGRREYADAGGLLSYGADRRPLYQATAGLVHRILHGAKPAEIPVEQISVIRTIINVKAAKSLGIKIPDSIRLRADELIE
jgi:putative ABC transport system substrate-binding protein